MIRKQTDPYIKLNQTRTERLWNKQMFTKYFNLKGSIFILIHCIIFWNYLSSTESIDMLIY